LGRAAVVRLDHCVIAVSDWERSSRFYRDVLGAEVVELGKGPRTGSVTSS
jgi:catechol 2,3-dioxygenase-like lactoylglutathione lyase family enzyme